MALLFDAITYDQIKAANGEIKTTPIKGKDYADVPERIKAFRKVYPTGAIETEMISNENGVCVFRAAVKAPYLIDDEKGDFIIKYTVLGTGTAYEKENSSFINKTSYIENCETSAVGRALGMAGFGIDTSVASYEEVQNAIANQDDEKPRINIKTAEDLYKYASDNGWGEDVVIRASQSRFGLTPEELTEKQIAEAAEIIKPKEKAAG